MGARHFCPNALQQSYGLTAFVTRNVVVRNEIIASPCGQTAQFCHGAGGSSSFLKKRTKKLLCLGHPSPDRAATAT
jgi:hypothetical protein